MAEKQKPIYVPRCDLCGRQIADGHFVIYRKEQKHPTWVKKRLEGQFDAIVGGFVYDLLRLTLLGGVIAAIIHFVH